MATYEPSQDDLSRNHDLDFLDNFYNWNESLNVTDTTNSGTNTVEATIPKQEHQNYYGRRDQQHIYHALVVVHLEIGIV